MYAIEYRKPKTVAEAAQALGREFAARNETDEARLQAIFFRCFSRSPRPEEMPALVDFLARQRQRCRAGELDSAMIAGDGPGEAHERAAWTLLARVLMNLDEFVSKW